ncbi:MAG TPA: glycoside hydrolase family 92 protein, partial [Bacteroidales bacterium]|nr:glycoside hydrolase family 92 protein [Bacteroidales bacterium]
FFFRIPIINRVITIAFEEIKLEPEGGRSFTISTSNAGSDDRIIRSVAANGRKIKKNVISHSQIIQGGEMVYNFKD